MVRKITAFLTALLISTSFSVIAADDSSAVTQDLINLGIVADADDLRLDENVSRAEAIKMICVMAQYDVDSTASDHSYFPDVSTNHWALKYISAGYEYGIINGNEDGFFCPEDTVTSTELQKMLVCALGYNEYAQNIGGYPHGYLSFANSLGISKNISIDADVPLDRNNAMTLIYNALDVPIMEVGPFENGEDSYTFDIRIYDGTNYPFQSFRTRLSGI